MSTDTEKPNCALVRCACETHECENTILLLNPNILHRNTIGKEEECAGYVSVASLSFNDLRDLHMWCEEQLDKFVYKP